LVTLYGAFIDPDYITPVYSTIPAIFAKSSTVWSTIFFIITNKSIKSKLSFTYVSKNVEINIPVEIQLIE
jgi:hypothetical protein